MKQCRIASCCKLAHHPCCADCKDRACTVRCLNSPERCGCWEDSDPRPPIRRPRKSKVDCQVGCSSSMVSVILREMGG